MKSPSTNQLFNSPKKNPMQNMASPAGSPSNQPASHQHEIMEQFTAASVSASITNANIVFETKIRIIDILQV